MIPKRIHYCWFGKGKMPELAVKCINSWKRILPDYELIRWDEETFDINSCDYVREAYEARKYAFVTDYVRLFALYNYGGIYMDTDVEVFQNLDRFLGNVAFSGFENESSIPTGIMAAEKGYHCFGELLNDFRTKHFFLENGKYDYTTNVETITNYYRRKGLVPNNTKQVIDGFLVMPAITFCPAPEDIIKKNMSLIYTVHHKNGSWIPHELRVDKNSFKYRYKIKIKKLIKFLIGYNNYGNTIRFINKYRKLDTYNKKSKNIK